MTLCDECREPMVIRSTLLDFGEGDEEIEFEACTGCRIVHVSGFDWRVVPA